ncbi:TOG array regulator of axonemal microtubules protein 1 [Holothuria leucospilota]|uniref:TOG array regulator of axonemal microtubules protein 1 n=1 Tax=Holothuria leucospilota TaxID=206669 RepID=A0A9Q1CJ30_HOLLE|nr:TOG array regulator of axonemal microtubules protein 1 [Holothuria leucospilota]
MAETVVNLPPNNLPQERHEGPNARHMVINNTRLIPTGVDLTRTRDRPRPKNTSVSEKNGVDSWEKRDNGDLAMEENDILDQLRDPNYVEHRSYLLDELYSRVNKYAGQVAIENRQDLFLSLAHALEDYDWEVRQKTVEIIGIVLPHLGDELDHCMDYVLPQVIYNVGDKKVVVRKAAIQTLHLYMQHTSNLSRVFHAVVKYGLEHADRAVNIQATVSLPIFLTSDFASSDIYPIIHSLAVKLCKGQDAELVAVTAVTLEAISKKVGQERFNIFIERFPPEIKELYEVKSKHFKDSENLDLNSNQKGVIDKSLPQEFARSAIQNEVTNSHSVADLHLSQDNNILRFGIIPQNIMNGLMDQDDWYGRLTATQALKTLISKLDNTSQLKTQFVAFVSFLCQLLEDSNFKVSLVTIEIFQELVCKLNQEIKQYLRPVVSALTKRFGDNKTVIRQANMRVMRKLMQTLEPKPVIDVVSESLRHKKSGVREEALHIIIAALLTFPSNDFDLPKLCDCVAPTLGDPKRKVRQASLETFAVLAQAMGPTKITPLIRAVDGIELQMNDEGVMKAVQARLARRQLPRINAEDTVELPSPLPSSASSRSASSVGFDTVWILKAAGSTGSAKDRSYTDPAIELSQPSPNKSAQNSSTFQELTPPKRFHSAGRGRSKLPWEEDRDDRPEVDEDRISDIFDGTSTGRGQLNSAPSQQKPQEIKPPFKPRQTWNSSDPNLFESSIRRQRPGFLNDKQDLWESPGEFLL